MRLALLLSFMAVPSVVCVPSAISAQPPATPVRPVTDTYHGVKVVDPYRWLEKDRDPEVKAWSDAENDYARSILDRLPNVEAIRRRVTEIMSARSPSYASATYRGGRYFAVKTQPPKQQPLIITLASLDDLTSERVVLDPNELDPTGATSIDWYVASPDGKLVAVSLSVGGSEAGDLHIFSTETGRGEFEVVPYVNSGTAGGDVAWSPDSQGFFYTRHPWPNERPAEDRGFYQQVYYHQLGTNPADDRYEMGKNLPRIAEIQLDADDATGRVLASVQNGDGGEFAHFLREEDGTWRQFTHFQDQTVQVVFGRHDDLFLVSLRDAPRGKIQHLAIADLGQPATTIVPQADDAIQTSFMEYADSHRDAGPAVRGLSARRPVGDSRVRLCGPRRRGPGERRRWPPATTSNRSKATTCFSAACPTSSRKGGTCFTRKPTKRPRRRWRAARR